MADDYSVVESDTMGELVEAVVRLQRLGWNCQGGICMVWDPVMPAKAPKEGWGGFVYAQALVRTTSL